MYIISLFLHLWLLAEALCISEQKFYIQGSYRSWKSWKVLEFEEIIFQAWKVLEL